MCFYRYFFTGFALLFSGFLATFNLNAQSPVPSYLAALPDGERLVDVAILPEGRMVVASMRSERMDRGDRFPWKKELHGMLRLLNEQGEVLAEREAGGSGKTVIRGVAVMPDGRVAVTGWTQSLDFPVIDPLFPSIRVPSPDGDPTRGQGFVAIYASDLSAVLRATLLGDPNPEFRFRTDPSLIAVDASSRIYIAGATDPIAGATDAEDFPVAPGNRNLSRDASWPSMGVRRGGTFVTVFDGELSEYLFSAMLGWMHSGCEGGSSCSQVDHSSTPLAMHVSAAGRVTLLAENAALPVTPGAITVNQYAAQGTANRYQHLGVAVFDTQNAALVWAADLGRPQSPRTGRPRMVVDAQGGVRLAVEAGLREAPGGEVRRSLDILHIASDGASLLQRDVLAEGLGVTLDGFLLDADGKYWLTGSAGATRWEPIPAEARAGSQFLLRFHPIARVSERYLLLPNGSANFLVQGADPGVLWLAGRTGVLERFQRGSAPALGLLGVANAAGLEISGSLSPGEIVSLYGAGFGPDTGQGAVFDSSDHLPRQLNGVEVLLNGKPCPLLYASGVQINLITPFDAPGFAPTAGPMLVEVKHQGVVRAQARVAAAQARPHVFYVVRDWQPNPMASHTDTFPILQVYGREATGLPGSPVKKGDVLTLWMNGAGAWSSAAQAGARAEAPFDKPRLRLRAILGLGCGSTDAELAVEYFGAAPGFAAGLIQANLRVPEDFDVPYPIVGCLSLNLGEDTADGFRPIADAPFMRVQLGR